MKCGTYYRSSKLTSFGFCGSGCEGGFGGASGGFDGASTGNKGSVLGIPVTIVLIPVVITGFFSSPDVGRKNAKALIRDIMYKKKLLACASSCFIF